MCVIWIWERTCGHVGEFWRRCRGNIREDERCASKVLTAISPPVHAHGISNQFVVRNLVPVSNFGRRWV